jgi:hypothetical protein
MCNRFCSNWLFIDDVCIKNIYSMTNEQVAVSGIRIGMAMQSTPSTTNLKLPDLALNPDLCGRDPANNHCFHQSCINISVDLWLLFESRSRQFSLLYYFWCYFPLDSSTLRSEGNHRNVTLTVKRLEIMKFTAYSREHKWLKRLLELRTILWDSG